MKSDSYQEPVALSRPRWTANRAVYPTISLQGLPANHSQSETVCGATYAIQELTIWAVGPSRGCALPLLARLLSLRSSEGRTPLSHSRCSGQPELTTCRAGGDHGRTGPVSRPTLVVRKSRFEMSTFHR